VLLVRFGVVSLKRRSVNNTMADDWWRMTGYYESTERPQAVAKVVCTTFSLGGSTVLLWAIAEMSKFRYLSITEFDRIILLVMMLQIGLNIVSISDMNEFLWPKSNLDTATDDIFDDLNKKIYMKEFFEFFFLDCICMSVNLLAFNVWFVVVQEKRLRLGKSFGLVVSIFLVVASIPALLKVLCRFNCIYPRPTKRFDYDKGNCGGFTPTECQQNSVHWQFLNILNTTNIFLRLASVIFDFLFLSHVTVRLVRFRNPGFFSLSTTTESWRASPGSPMLLYATDKDGSKQYRSIRGCPLLELCRRLALFPLIQISTALPEIITFFVFEFKYKGESGSGGMYGCSEHYARCAHLPGFITANYFKSTLGVMGGVFFAVAYFAFHIKARRWAQGRLVDPVKRLCLAVLPCILSLHAAHTPGGSQDDRQESRQQTSSLSWDGSGRDDSEDNSSTVSASSASLCGGTWHHISLSRTGRASNVNKEARIEEVTTLAEDELLFLVKLNEASDDMIPPAVDEVLRDEVELGNVWSSANPIHVTNDNSGSKVA
jgi:hypothetical protein